MHQKKKKMFWFVIVAVLFLAAGMWYLFRGKACDEKALNLTGVTTADVAVAPEQLSEEQPRIFVVFVCGAVNRPGVYEVFSGCRLYEVLELAGGFCEGADTAYHNLARPVSDGERIYFLTREETAELTMAEKIDGDGTSAGTVQESQEIRTADAVDLNTATAEQLMTLPGIGQAKAEAIIEYRTKAGPFETIEELMNISGIGESMFEKLKDKIKVR